MKAMMFVTGAMTVNLIGLGDELGFYQALKASGGPMTSSELAKATGTHERWTREWLHQQASCSLTIGANGACHASCSSSHAGPASAVLNAHAPQRSTSVA